MAKNYSELPTDLPVPEDDGGADHLPGLKLRSLSLNATNGERVNLSQLPGRTIVYAYPRTGRPDEGVFHDGWEAQNSSWP